ncbi:hypothetical protein [Hymenobacter sp. CRA2]|uniref:hypothetical protein n=1 Tax=Hymenobacter sp. CRA2 TaxID=1955620 RepID=UPI00098F13CB|nr:hypothetical protein [Hymenobacter sp. CRA2]OON69386.1 hypothetical protein B0919_08885 [Hymenobacter sp. CRA2]
MQFTYPSFSQQPTAAQMASSPAAALWYLLDGKLTIAEQGQPFLQEDFPLFRLAALLHHWQAYRPAPLDEARLVIDEFEASPALTIRRQAEGITLSWGSAGRDVSSLTVLESEFARAGQVFLQQLQTDVQAQLGVDVRPLFRGIPF